MKKYIVHRTTKASLALCAVLAAGPAHAQGSAASSANAALAEQLFRDAKELLAQKDYERACPKFAESLRLDPTLGTELNLARCHEEWGHIASAWGEYIDVARRAAATNDPDRAKVAQERAQALESRLSRVTFVVQAPPKGFKLTIDGNELAASLVGSAIPMDPGEHGVSAQAPGMKSWETKLVVKPGPSTDTVTVPVEAAPATTTPADVTTSPGAPATESGRGKRTASYIAFGVGGLGLAAGTVFGVLALGKKSDIELCQGKACASDDPNFAKSKSAYQDAQTDALISTIGFSVAAAGLLVGTYLFLTSSSSQGDRALRVLPSVGSNNGALELRGAF